MTSDGSIERAGPLLLGALAPATFLLVDPAGWYPFGPVKWLAVSVLGCAGAGAVLVTRPVAVPRSLRWALGAWLGWLAVAAAAGLDPLYAWVGTPERRLGVLTWGLCALLLLAGTAIASSPRRPPVEPGAGGPAVAVVLLGLVVAGLGIGLVGTAEALGWEPTVLDVGSRLTATFGSAAYLGAATALLLPVCAAAALDPALGPARRRAAGAAVALLALTCVGTGARAAWFGLIVAAVVAGWCRRAWLRAHRRVALRVGALAVLAGAALLGLSPAGERLASLADPGAPGGRARLDEWRVATRVAVDHPLTGVGPEGYRIAFADGVDARYERAHGREQQPDRAHTAPLDIALAAGAPGLLAWAALIVIVGRRVLRGLRHGPTWVAGLAIALVAHLAGQLLLFPLAELEPVAWLLAGLVVGGVEGPPTTSRTTRHRWSRHLGVVAGVAALGALVSGATEVRADRRAGDAAEALARGDHRAAARAAVDAADQRPDIVRLHLLAGISLVADERGALAGIAQLDQALAVSPGDPVIRLARVHLLVDRADATRVPAHVAAASAELDRLLERDPANGALWQEASRLATVEGDEAAARAAAVRVAALTPPPRSS